jgi:molecular chaperone GrpE (heat shock protein)
MTLAAVDNFAGSSDLIAVRARQKTARPFTRVQEIQRTAEQKYQKEEVALNTKLQETQQRIAELQNQQGDAQSGGLVLTPEQQAEIDKFRKEMVSTRAELRNVRRGLREDIEKLETTMRVVNIAAMPLGVIGAALVIWVIRSVRRRA